MGKFMKSQPCLVVILSPQKIAEERTKDTLQKAKSGLLVDGPRLTRWTVFFFPRKIVVVVQRFILDSRNLQHVSKDVI